MALDPFPLVGICNADLAPRTSDHQNNQAGQLRLIGLFASTVGLAAEAVTTSNTFQLDALREF